MHYIQARQILTSNNGKGINVYRGCQHGCIYCDSRSVCYNFDHDFEDVAVKENAPALLETALQRKRLKVMIGSGSMCDPYMPVEKELRLTRRCLEIINAYNFGATVLTKSDLVLRDLDILSQINEKTKAVVQITLTTFDENLCKILEPNVCTTAQRFEVLCRCRDSGIPTVVWLDPILPFINDTRENLDGILDYCIRAGVQGIVCFGFGVTLRDGSRDYFYQNLDRHFPGLRHQYEQKYGNAYEINSPNHPELYRRFCRVCAEHSLLYKPNDVFAYLHRFEDKRQKPLPVQGELF